MTPDYDLVILGGTLAGREAAREARSWGARVALVEPVALEHTHLWHRQGHQTAVELAHQWYRQRLWGNAPSKPTIWEQIRPLTAIALEAHSLEPLALMGVDLCFGEFQFITRPYLAIEVSDSSLKRRSHRTLVGHAYLIATGAMTKRPDEAAADRIFTPETLVEAENFAFASVLIAGSTATAVELAQMLNRLGAQTTLLVEGDSPLERRSHRLLPHHDHAIAQRVHYLLEAEGVRVISQAVITTLNPLPDRVIVSSGSQTWEPEAVVLATLPTIDGSGLEALSLSLRHGYLQVNSHLQTSHPRVFACGDVLGHSSPQRSHDEAKLAVKNALFWPKKRVNYRSIPDAVATDLPLARVGMTEAQARSRYGDAVTVLQCSLPSTVANPSSIGFCKLLVHKNGQILGAHVIAPQAETEIEAIALAIRHRLPITSLASVPVVAELVQQWEGDRRNRNSLVRSLRETWFHWRR